MHVAFDCLCCAENFATNGMVENVRVQSLCQRRPFRQRKEAAVVNEAGADVTSLQWNDPDPPAATEQMIRGPLTRGSATVRIIRKTFPPVVAVPFLHAGKSRPHSIDRMLSVLAKIAKLASDYACASGGIDEPPRGDRAFASVERGADSLCRAVVQLEICHF